MTASEAYEEFPVFFPAAGNQLSAVICVPSGDASDVGVLLLPSSAASRVHRNAMWVRAARELAARGFASMRVDYHGTGDSAGNAFVFDLDAPFIDDVVAAAAYFRAAVGVDALAIGATCFGSRCAVASLDRIDRVLGAALLPTDISAPLDRTRVPFRTRVKRWLRRHEGLARAIQHTTVMKARKRVADREGSKGAAITISRPFQKDVIAFLDRGDLWFVYGDEDKRYPQLQQCLADLEPYLTPDRRARLHLEVAPGRWLEKFHSLDDQRYSIDSIILAVESMAAAREPVA